MSSSHNVATPDAMSALPNGAAQSPYPPENKTQKQKQSSKHLEEKGHRVEEGEQAHEDEDEEHSDHQHMSEEWPIESQKVKDEQIQAFYREYAKRITAALTQYANQDREGPSGVPEDDMANGKEYAFSPSPEKLLELYATMLRDNKDSTIRDALMGKAFSSSSVRRPSETPQPCGCGSTHGESGPLNFLDSDFDEELDNMEDEDDDDDDDDDYDDEDDDDDDYDDDDDDDDDEDEEEEEEGSIEMYDDGEEDQEDQDVDSEAENGMVDGYAHHYDNASPELLAHEEEMRRLENIRKVREEELRLKEILKTKQLLEKQRQRQEQERLEQFEKQRLEEQEQKKRTEEETRLREQEAEEELRRRKLATDDQNARSLLFTSVSESNIGVVKKIMETSPQESGSVDGILPFSTASVTRVSGWEHMLHVDGMGEIDLEKGFTETLLHIAVRNESLELVTYLIEKGAPLDAVDFDGHTPMHVAAINSVALPICKLLVERTMPHIDRTTITTSKTALHYAAMQGFADLVELLLVNQAKINIADLTGKTPESYAKAGLEEAMAEKAAKKLPKNAANAKIQRYRMSLQYLHKAMATIREAQIRRDAQLEEQRRKEEALAREEEEKDKAARRKQEEKLEADMRRQQEQERELERLKAMAAANSNSQSSGSGGKKKKKKKSKGTGDQQQHPPQPAQPQKQQLASANIALSSPALSMSSSSPSLSTGSPAIAANTEATPSKPTSLPQSQQPLPAAPQRNSSNAGPALTITGSIPSSVRSAAAETSSPSKSSSSAPAPTSTPPSQPSRLPKIKTSYRPTPLVVTRMMDMGFPSRVSRKALIMTEGKVEEAIDLLTSGAPLADDSEDEAERKAETSRLKAAKRSATVPYPSPSPAPATVTVEQKKQQLRAEDMERSETVSRSEALGSAVSTSGNSPTTPVSVPSNATFVPALVPSTPKPQPVLSSSATRASSQKTSVKVNPPSTSGHPNAYRSGHPVQILQRTHPMAAHVQMRSVPTQVLQHAHPTGTSSTTRKSFSGEGRSIAPPQPLAQKPPPFVAPPPVHRLPPTRAPYSYGAKPAATSSQPTDATQDSLSPTALGPTLPSSTPTQPPQSDTGVGSGFVLPKAIMDDISGAEGYGSSSPYSGTQSTEYTGFADEQPSWTPVTNLSVPSGIDMGGSYSSAPGKLWSTSESRSEIGFGAIDTGMGMGAPSPFMSNLSVSGSRTHLSVIGSSRSGGLSGAHGYNPEMEQPDVDIIKDVLAMTGAIDSDDFVEGLDNEFSFKRSSPMGTLSSLVPSRAVGGGRAQSHPTSSLWSGDAFGGLISPISQSFSSGRLGADSSSGDAFFNDAPSTPGGTSTYSQWSSGFGPDQTMLSSPHRSSFVDSFFGSLNEPDMTGQSLSNSFVDISSPTSATFELHSGVIGSGGQPSGSGVQKQSLLNLLSSPSSSGMAPTMISPSTTVFGYDMDLQPGDIVAPELAHQQQARRSPTNTRLSPSERYTRLNQGGSQSYFDV
ncbi:hypothetical protein BGZ59_003714 [Podila verticillata]|nr:hypothetical protein BGZ59_003714 [Podila verticillata]KFH70198.1 hypothetical protein MVEG_05000 [Podila verticillata NRRL 6337]